MKKLGKLTINPEKVIKNDELVNLKGGYEGGEYFLCSCTAGVNPPYQSPWCKEYTSAQDMISDIETKCVGGEGTCNAGCF